MAATNLVSVEEYLHATFEHDAEYVDGTVVPRSSPEKSHSKMQGFLARTLYETAHPVGYEVWVKQRIRTRMDPRRYRIPDVCMTLGEPKEEVFVDPPFLCVEILSPDDSAVDLRMKIEEYLAMGVSYIWVVDPISLTGEVYSGTSIERVREGIFIAGDFEVNVASLR
jgi:Uma2 family endonuclease